jgi:endoglucanase
MDRMKALRAAGAARFAAALMLVGAVGGPLAAAGVASPAMPGVNVPAVKVDTVGWPNGAQKMAILNVEPAGFQVLDSAGRVAYAGKPGDIRAQGVDAASQDRVWQADFSALTRTGQYRVRLEWKKTVLGAGLTTAPFDSDPFTIAPHPYDRALVAAQKMFYYQRTRTQLQEPYTLWDADDDDYTRAGVSHAHDNVGWVLDSYPEKTVRWKAERGWFDAGNEDMYIPSTAPSAQMLLMAYELSPQAFGDANGIPESGNGIPDILDEAAWGLDWVASLQTPEGAFRAREATMRLGVVPEGDASQDQTERWVSGIASASTAKACAALAKASRVFLPFDRARSQRYGRAAQRAWAWLKAHPGRLELDGKGAEQPLWDDGPEYPSEDGARAAAAFEMWRSFRQNDALEDLQRRWNSPQVSGGMEGGWPNIGRFAVLGVLLDGQAPQGLREDARQRLFQAVAPYQAVIQADGYRCALRKDEYYWGSPSVLMEKAALLALAARIDPQGHAWCAEAARDQWHWVLGRNPNGYSLVSRVGHGPNRIYHTEWGHKRTPPPGFLVDGPNFSNAPFLSPDAPAKALLWFSPTDLPSGVKAGDPWHNDQRDLWDGGFVERDQWSTGWWVVTEVDLYYNAGLVLAGALITP